MQGNYQLIPVKLGTASFAAGGRATVDFTALQAQLAGRICHLRGVTFDVQATPTLSSGTATPAELQKAVNSVIISDGVKKRFEGSFSSLRVFEALESGRLRAPENDAAATTEAVNFLRLFDCALPKFKDPTDFVLPAACWSRGGSIQFGFGALTDVDANCTALTMTITVTAWVQLHDEVIMGALVERKEQVITNGTAVGQQALYAFLALADAATFAAPSAGDWANVQISANGFDTRAIHVAELERAYHAAMDVGSFSQVHGEPRAATDDNPREAAATALAAAAAVASPIIWSPPGAKISKMVYSADPNLTLNWSGTQANGYGLMSRILPRSDNDYGAYAALVAAGLGIPMTAIPEARTDSKKPYRGPRRAYLPVKVKVG
jgi:hypothetical protein